MNNIKKSNKPHRDFLFAALTYLALLAGVSALAADYGFRHLAVPEFLLHTIQIFATTLLIVSRIHNLARHSWATLLSRRVLLDVTLLLTTAIALIVDYPNNTWPVIHLYLLILILLRVGRITLTITAAVQSPTRVLLLSFSAIIFAGAILLMLPTSHNNSMSFTDAVFTSTSATCVTGLIVKDTPHDFTRQGQTIILFLMQIGGLGIMIFGAVFSLLMGSSLSFRETAAMGDLMSEQTPARIGRIVLFIFAFTFAAELLGVFALQGLWPESYFRNASWFKSIFHSVSAFCNAGFALQSDSLMSFRDKIRPYAVICPLIIIGGLGFPVLHNLNELTAWKFHKLYLRLRYIFFAQSRYPQRPPTRLTLQSKLVLITTAVLLLSGTGVFFLLEFHRSDSSLVMTLWDSFFNAVTARTAGFNTVDIASLSPPAKFFLILLMSIGGSPCSTAGGIKTVTLAVMVLAIYNTICRRENIEAFKRTIPTMIIRRGFMLMLLYLLILVAAVMTLMIFESPAHHDSLDLLFESASALGTVGLSTGITPHLSTAGKWIIIITMFAGRLGPLSLLAAVTVSARTPRYNYPTEELAVG